MQLKQLPSVTAMFGFNKYKPYWKFVNISLMYCIVGFVAVTLAVFVIKANFGMSVWVWLEIYYKSKTQFQSFMFCHFTFWISLFDIRRPYHNMKLKWTYFCGSHWCVLWRLNYECWEEWPIYMYLYISSCNIIYYIDISPSDYMLTTHLWIFCLIILNTVFAHILVQIWYKCSVWHKITYNIVKMVVCYRYYTLL